MVSNFRKTSSLGALAIPFALAGLASLSAFAQNKPDSKAIQSLSQGMGSVVQAAQPGKKLAPPKGKGPSQLAEKFQNSPCKEQALGIGKARFEYRGCMKALRKELREKGGYSSDCSDKHLAQVGAMKSLFACVKELKDAQTTAVSAGEPAPSVPVEVVQVVTEEKKLEDSSATAVSQ
jgi:hypothetical protein